LRSRAKRVMREAARAAGAPWVGVDSVFVAREGTAASSPAQLARDMETIKKRHG
jgi:ribonuclease P protein component